MKRIPVNWLNKHAYCEYQIYLEHVKGVQAELTDEAQLGQEKHAALDEEHKKAADLELTVSDALTKAQQDGAMLISRDILVEGGPLYGAIDEVQFMPDQVRIIDDKPGNIPYFTGVRQVGGYCLAFQKQFNPALPVIAVLRNRDTGEEIWAMPFLQEYRDDVLGAIRRIRGILRGQIQPEPTRNANKCKSCRLRTSCDAKCG